MGTSHTLVAYVIRHSLWRVIWSDIGAYIVGSSHTLVVYVIRQLFGTAFWRDVNKYIVGSGHNPVVCVKRYLVGTITWEDIKIYAASSGHIPVCKMGFGCHLNTHHAYVLVIVFISVMCGIGHFYRVAWYDIIAHIVVSAHILWLLVYHMAFSWNSSLITYQLWWWLALFVWCDSLILRYTVWHVHVSNMYHNPHYYFHI
jgi:hypothetical protein